MNLAGYNPGGKPVADLAAHPRSFLLVDSPRSFQEPAVLPGLPEVGLEKGPLERMDIKFEVTGMIKF